MQPHPWVGEGNRSVLCPRRRADMWQLQDTVLAIGNTISDGGKHPPARTVQRMNSLCGGTLERVTCFVDQADIHGLVDISLVRWDCRSRVPRVGRAERALAAQMGPTLARLTMARAYKTCVMAHWNARHWARQAARNTPNMGLLLACDDDRCPYCSDYESGFWD